MYGKPMETPIYFEDFPSYLVVVSDPMSSEPHSAIDYTPYTAVHSHSYPYIFTGIYTDTRTYIYIYIYLFIYFPTSLCGFFVFDR